MYFTTPFDYICKVKDNSFNDPKFTNQVKRTKSKRLAKVIADLVDLKVKGIITEQEFKQRKHKLLGFWIQYYSKVSKSGQTIT